MSSTEEKRTDDQKMKMAPNGIIITPGIAVKAPPGAYSILDTPEGGLLGKGLIREGAYSKS